MVEMSDARWAVHSDGYLAVSMDEQSVVKRVADLAETKVSQRADLTDNVSVALMVVSTADSLVVYLDEQLADQLADCWAAELVDWMAASRDKKKAQSLVVHLAVMSAVKTASYLVENLAGPKVDETAVRWVVSTADYWVATKDERWILCLAAKWAVMSVALSVACLVVYSVGLTAVRMDKRSDATMVAD